MTETAPWLRFALGAAAGVLSGFGIGGGTLLVIALVFLLGAEQRAAQGANLWYFFPTAAAALLIHAKKGRVAWKIVLPAAAAGLVSALLGASAASRMDMALLRRLFGVLLACTGAAELRAKK